HNTHQWRARVDAELLAQPATGRLGVQQRGELKPKADRLELAWWGNAVAGDFVALAVADDDDAVGDQAKRAFNGQEHAGLRRAEVAVEDVAVVRVHDQRHATDSRRETTDGASLGHVGVDHIRRQAGDELDNAGQGDQLVERIDLAPERGQHDWLDRASTCQAEDG